jgi:putative transposase
MSHSIVKMGIHAIWSTKLRQPIISAAIEKEVYSKMKEEFHAKECAVKIINGMPDHVHSLFMLSSKVTIEDIIKQVKGATSHFINASNLTSDKFSWQTGYAAYAVSESQIEKVYNYILNQKVHHKKISFQKEYDDFMRLHGLQAP